MTQNLPITGNGVTFQDESDLTDETRDAIYAVFLQEVERQDIRTPDGGPAEGMKAATRAIKRVEALATAAGWTPRCTALLGVVAGDIYGRLIAETAKEVGLR